MREAFSACVRSVTDLLARLGRDHLRYYETLVYQQRLAENLAQTKQHSDIGACRAECSEIVLPPSQWTLEGEATSP